MRSRGWNFLLFQVVERKAGVKFSENRSLLRENNIRGMLWMYEAYLLCILYAPIKDRFFSFTFSYGDLLLDILLLLYWIMIDFIRYLLCNYMKG